MTETLKNLSLFCAALGIPHENMPDSERLTGLVSDLRRDFTYQGSDPVPRAQMMLLAEACGHLVSVIDDRDMIAAFAGLNAFDLDAYAAEAEARVAVCTKLAEIMNSSNAYCEGFARLMCEVIQRALKLRNTFTENDVLVYRSLEQLFFMREIYLKDEKYSD